MDIAIAAPAPFVPLVSPPLRGHGRSRRQSAIGHYQILDSSPETAFDNIAMLAAHICDAQSAAISFIDDHRHWFKATFRIDQGEMPITSSFCAHAIEQSTVFIVKDARHDPRFAANPLVTGGKQMRFYAGMRIVASDDTPVATLSVFDPCPRPQGLTQVQRTTLRVLAAQVQALLELRISVIERQTQAARQSALSKELQHVAEHDVLTGLPHRGLFNKRLIAAMRDADRKSTRIALMLVDIDHFKQINDSLGHDVGDALLCGFADRLREAVRKTDTAARLGGDEFGVLLSNIRHDRDLATIIQSINNRLGQPIEHHGRQVDCQASIGLAIYPDHANTPEGLTKCSDLALAEAKRSRGCVETFRPRMVKEFQREAKMLSVAREGVEGHGIVPFYQPKLNLATGALVGFEALVRFDLTGRAPVLPEMFALAFTDRKLAAAIGQQMLTRVLDDVRCWADCGLEFGHVAINSCAADFSGDDFAEMLLSALEVRGLPPRLIELEVTEGVFLGRGAHHVKRALCLLSDRGMRIALDDFGTGYASLIHLKQFPVDVLKIDRSFIAGIGKNPDDTAIVRALIGLGISLGIETVAEGIETRAQAEFVKAHGGDVGQGFLYSAALPADQVPEMIQRLQHDANTSSTAPAFA
jgi:diguanylate cyclase (GGDEF)-like protein